MYVFNLGLKFEFIAKAYPSHIALAFENGESIEYKALNGMANQFARFLIELDLKPKDVVAISGDKCIETFIGIIACLKIGVIYTVFDPDSPPERLSRIFARALPKIIFGDNVILKKFADVTAAQKISTINIGAGFREKIDRKNADNLPVTRTITGKNPAYLMFTSGSTGFPKGAVMTHRNVLNFIEWSITTYNITPEDVLTNVNPMFFDNSVFDIYSSFFSGATLVPFSRQTVTDPKTMLDIIDARKCTIWFSVPSLLIFLQTMKALNKNNFRFIKKIIFGGEGFPKPKLKQLFDIYGERAQLFNVYGPTECTCICSSYPVTEDDFTDLQGYPPIGYIIENFSYVILDENHRKVEDNHLGELCLMGPNVGKGYYNDPERTCQNFIQNPHNDNYHEKIYKTGDLVKYNPDDGKLHIFGRVDNQIKHMGYRIELEEIENALCRIEKISQAVAIQGAVRGLSRIVAVVSSKHSLDSQSITKDLKPILPDYMMPADIHIMDELPKNPNGKVDRRILKEMFLPG